MARAEVIMFQGEPTTVLLIDGDDGFEYNWDSLNQRLQLTHDIGVLPGSKILVEIEPDKMIQFITEAA
jgi:hypothetical protein